MSIKEIARVLNKQVKDGIVDPELSQKLFSSIGHKDQWDSIEIDSPIPNTSYAVTQIDKNLRLSQPDKKLPDDCVYLIVRHTGGTRDDYESYMKKEYQMYRQMTSTQGDMLIPVGFGFSDDDSKVYFGFLSTTNFTVDEMCNHLSSAKLQDRVSDIVEISSLLKDMGVSGFYLTPKTILVKFEKKEVQFALIGYVGTRDVLELCSRGMEFHFNNYSAPELTEKVFDDDLLAPSEKSDVYALGRVSELLLGEDVKNEKYKDLIKSSLIKKTTKRLTLTNFIDQIKDLLANINTNDDDNEGNKEPKQKQKKATVQDDDIYTQSNAQNPQPDTQKHKKSHHSHAKDDSCSCCQSANNVAPIQTFDYKQLLINGKLIERVINKQCKLVSGKNQFPPIYQVKGKRTKTSDNNMVKRIIVGPKSDAKKHELVILVVGQTGAGKTTFINGILNYLYGVEYADKYRLKIVVDEGKANHSISQTDDVILYSMQWQPEFPVPCHVTIIDTPGFGDTRGTDYDEITVNKLKALFSSDIKEVQVLNAVVFVAQAHNARLGPQQKYVFSQIMQLFGKDIADNIVIAATFADGGDPQVLAALEKDQIPTKNLLKFNNSALFAEDKTDPMCKQFWEMGYESYYKFFNCVSRLQQKSLKLTHEVMEERNRLFTQIDALHIEVKRGVNKMKLIEDERQILQSLQGDIEQNKNFTYTVEEEEIIKLPLEPGKYVTNCTKCNKTCHYPCWIPDDRDKAGCWAMNGQGICRICGCHWQIHKNNGFRWNAKPVTVTKTMEDLKKKYGDAHQRKQNSEQMIQNALDQYNQMRDNTYKIVEECRRVITRLHEIAMRPINMTECDYIEQMIRNEEEEKRPGWDRRVKQYKELLTRYQFIGTIAQGGDPLAAFAPKGAQVQAAGSAAPVPVAVNMNEDDESYYYSEEEEDNRRPPAQNWGQNEENSGSESYYYDEDSS